MASSRSADRQQALYRALLLLYPRRFRRSYAEPMARLFADCVRDQGAVVWRRTLPDLVRTVPSQRIEAVMARVASGARPLVLMLVVLAAAGAVIGFMGRGAVLFGGLAVVGVLATQRGVFSSLRSGERAPLRHAVTQTWWAPVAALLGLAMLLFGVGTIFEAHNWGGRIFGSAILMAFGTAMVLGLMRRPFDRQAGNSLILLATIPPLLFFWVIVPPLAAVLVWIGVLSSGFGDRPVASAS